MLVDRFCCLINILRIFVGWILDLVNCFFYKVEDIVDYNVIGIMVKV